MAKVTRIVRRGRRCRLEVGEHILLCDTELVEKKKLDIGMELSGPELEKIEQLQRRRDCYRKATWFLGRRMHSRAELEEKLLKAGYEVSVIAQVVGELKRMGYVNDAEYATERAAVSVQRKRGRLWAQSEIEQAGVNEGLARRAVEGAYGAGKELEAAREFAAREGIRLKKLDAGTARRRLAGSLSRRGFEADLVQQVVEEIFGTEE
jgi:regulatory protein